MAFCISLGFAYWDRWNVLPVLWLFVFSERFCSSWMASPDFASQRSLSWLGAGESWSRFGVEQVQRPAAAS